MERCERCGTEVQGLTTASWFNEQMICLDCDEKEHAHPDIERAKAAERKACARGDFNFRGLGLPPDLQVKK